MAYTLKICFEKGGKVYHFASMAKMPGTMCSVRVSTTYWGREDKSVYIVGHEDGISTRATKWRTGSKVTQEQRLKHPHKPVKETKMNKISFLDMTNAIDTLVAAVATGQVGYIGINSEQRLTYNTGKNNVTVGVSAYGTTSLLNHLNKDPLKTKLEQSLKELMDKTEEIKKQIKEM